jgi:S-adenosylmethionine:tRNA ribosyltransferase-isomerase
MPMSLTLADFDYVLPPELIAQTPLPQRSSSRLLVLDGDSPQRWPLRRPAAWLRPGDLLVMNDSRVLHARMLGRKESGGQVEVLVERLLDEREVLAQVRASKSPQPGSQLLLEDALDVEVLGRSGEFYRLRFPGDRGRTSRAPRTAAAASLYRTQGGSARRDALPDGLCPRAGLGGGADRRVALRPGIACRPLREMGVELSWVTLHVGAGTFQPVRANDLAEHRMHTERYVLPQATVDSIAATRARGGRIVAVGTTSLRVLESAAQGGDMKVGCGETALFVTPGFEFKVVDLLVTNFHLPKSTLLMLVSAFGGLSELRAAYRHAIAAGYRFFSYGDAMLLHKRPIP